MDHTGMRLRVCEGLLLSILLCSYTKYTTLIKVLTYFRGVVSYVMFTYTRKLLTVHLK